MFAGLVAACANPSDPPPDIAPPAIQAHDAPAPLRLDRHVAELAVDQALFAGTQPQALIVRDNIAWIADVHGLSTVRVTRHSLEALGRVATPGVALDVAAHSALDEDRAFVADGPAGVAVVDIRDPRAPRLVEQIPIQGGAALVAAGPHAVVALGYDASTVTLLDRRGQPTARRTMDGAPSAALWMGDTLFVAGRGFGLQILDARDLGTRWTAPIFDDVRALAARPPYVYAFDADAALHVFDTSAATPQKIRTVATRRIAQRAFVAGDWLVVTNQVGDSALVIDISAPQAPAIPDTGVITHPMRAAALGPEGTIVAADDSPGLRVVELSGPTTRMASQARAVRPLARLAGARLATIEQHGDGLLATGYAMHTMIATTAPPHPAAAPAWAGVDEHAPVRLLGIDASGAVYERARLPRAELAIGCGAHVCTASAASGLAVLAMNDRDALAPVAHVDLDEPAVALAYDAKNRVLWQGTERGVLHAYAMTDAAALVATRSLPSERPALGSLAARDGTLLALEQRTARLHVRHQPQRAEVLLQARATDLTLYENRALISGWRFGLQIVDIGDPGQVREQLWQPTEPAPLAAAMLRTGTDRGLIALALGEHGVALARWQDGARTLEPLAFAPTPGVATDLCFAHGALWIADTSALLRANIDPYIKGTDADRDAAPDREASAP